MKARNSLAWLPVASFAALAAFDHAYGFGADGHRIAGLIAQKHLCAEAEQEVRTLGLGQRLDQLGLWADWIRGEPEWQHSAPWHYMNIPDGARLEDYRHPPEGDILWAIRHFAATLADRQEPMAERRDALRFLAHFVVDIHQPLHVGRESDRGGNRIDVDPGASGPVNLHRFWDTNAVALSGLEVEDYVLSLAGLIEAHAPAWEQDTLMDWARESQALRPDVYDFGGRGNRLSSDYLENAERIMRLRLAQAGIRLAAEVNRVLCGPASASP
ncbi:MAG: S1/P1 nuclease [Rhodospirillaceae bacterium]|nr:S1/P1 nuclease [Rhodospirillaceae bacterium]